uniref:Uncharacterized protein n=1 Tax=Rhizophora mucronata TaxID=61149 RepID=A0A2P2QXS5_RHIMU
MSKIIALYFMIAFCLFLTRGLIVCIYSQFPNLLLSSSVCHCMQAYSCKVHLCWLFERARQALAGIQMNYKRKSMRKHCISIAQQKALRKNFAFSTLFFFCVL